MSWRGLFISNPAHLSLRDNGVLVAREEGDLRFALEDLSWIVLDTPRITVTAALLSACMESSILLMTVDRRHLPNGALLPFHTHFRQGETIRRQLAASLPLKKRLWQRIIQRKIRNQADHLDALGHPGVERLKRMAADVPDEGHVRALHVTERQYGRMRVLSGAPELIEAVLPKQLVLL